MPSQRAMRTGDQNDRMQKGSCLAEAALLVTLYNLPRQEKRIYLQIKLVLQQIFININ
jgi:hypothetical protein